VIPSLPFGEDEADIVKSHGFRAICYRSKPAQLERLESLVKSINHFWRTKVNLLRRKQSG
jgi:hypothetical protein